MLSILFQEKPENYVYNRRIIDYKHCGLIFYLNTNNGFTILDDGTKIESVENRALFFDPSKRHCSTTCTDSIFRSIIIINYF